jgi:predicted nucleic acid-binding protein
MSKAFLDTNVLAYACDQDTPAKRDAARALLRQVASGVAPCISTQVLQEFYVVATGKLSIAPLQAKDIIRSFRRFEVVTIDADDVERAVDGNILWQVSFWDALIIVAAQKARCEVLYSEDLNAGQAFDSLRVVNPFAAAGKGRGR